MDQTLKVYAIDVNDGTTSVVADFSDLPFKFGILPHGIAVYAPRGIPTLSQWGIVAMGLLLLSSGIVVLRRRVRTSNCYERSPAIERGSDFFGRNES